MNSASKKLFFFPGPCKSGTSWLYEQLNNHPEVYVIGGKDIVEFQSLCRQREIREKMEKDKRKIFCLFNHDAILDSKKVLAIGELNADVVVMVRDPVDQVVSRILHDLRSGDFNLSAFENCSDVNEVNSRFYERSDYNKFHSRLTKILKKKVNYIDFSLLSENEELVFSRLSEIMDISEKNFKRGLVSNKALSAKYPVVVRLIRKNIRPVFYFLKLNKFWSYLKLTKSAKIFYSEKPLDREKWLIKTKINHDYLYSRHYDFKKKCCGRK